MQNADAFGFSSPPRSVRLRLGSIHRQQYTSKPPLVLDANGGFSILIGALKFAPQLFANLNPTNAPTVSGQYAPPNYVAVAAIVIVVVVVVIIRVGISIVIRVGISVATISVTITVSAMTISAIAVSPITAPNVGSATVQDTNPTYTETSADLKPAYA